MTTTKPTAAPYATTAYTNPLLTATATAQISYEATADFKLVKTFKTFIIGQSSADAEPTKSMTKWSTDTAANRKTAGVDVSTNVSSFAIVVDITTKGKVTQPVYCGTSGTTEQKNVAGTPLTACTTIGAVGN